MTPEETIQRVREAMAALSQGDIDACGALIHPEYTYTVRGRASISGVYHGWEAMAGVLQRILDMTNGTLTAVPEIVLADEENVLMYMKVTASRPDGRTYDNYQAYRYRLKDGLIIDGETIPVDQEAFKEFFA
jgi:ketosteroid isomerase-like protein